MKVRLIATAALTAAGCAAMALPGFKAPFAEAYGIKKGAKLDSCVGCHTAGVKLNVYGADLKKVLEAAKKLTADLLKKIDTLDSDKDGVKNVDELKKGTNPGDPKDK
jgi:hypothetical protein